MQDGYDFDCVFYDESSPWPPASEIRQALIDELALHELAQAAGEAVASLADVLNTLMGIVAESLKTVMEMIEQYAQECAVEDSESEVFPEVMSCPVPESGFFTHERRIPWHTSGFQ